MIHLYIERTHLNPNIRKDSNFFTFNTDTQEIKSGNIPGSEDYKLYGICYSENPYLNLSDLENMVRRGSFVKERVFESEKEIAFYMCQEYFDIFL